MKLFSSTFNFLTGPIIGFTSNFSLLQKLVSRDVSQIYRGTILGALWSIATPLVMLGVYTFVFGYIFNASFGRGSSVGKLGFALGLFNGLIIWEFFSSVISQSPSLIVRKPNFVKKIVFPLQIIPLSQIGVSGFQFLVSWVLLIIAIPFIGQSPLPALFIPLFLIPITFYMAGLAWFLSSIGVFLRDTANAVTPVITFMLFLSAIFFPIASVPEQFRMFFYLNPVAASIEESRKLAIFGESPDILIIVLHCLAGWLVACVGYSFFCRTKNSFADVM
jgi:lipopolysaccharide transport system permease protein